jgi:RNA polymerase sigma-70 factor (ECF subfamily)
MTEPDAELIVRCREGDEEAFRLLVDRYKNLVFGVVHRMLPGSNRVEDVAQEVFLRIHRGLPYFRGQARLSTWVYRIVLNLCSEERGRPTREVSMTPAGDDAPRFDPGGPDAEFSRIEQRDRIDKALAELPPAYRLLIAAHYLEGVQYEDLAAALDMPLGTVKTQLHRAKKQLREIMQRSRHDAVPRSRRPD